MLPLVELLRPVSLTDIVGQKDHVQKFQQILQGALFPHLLLHGPAGIGKSSIVNAYTKDLKLKCQNAKMETVNASDKRTPALLLHEYLLPLFQRNSDSPTVVILEEADNLMTETQEGLCALMDLCKPSQPFQLIFILNDISCIDAQLENKCIKMQFKSLPVAIIVPYLQAKLTQKWSTLALTALVESCHGDLRQALNLIQQLQVKEEDTKQVELEHIQRFLPPSPSIEMLHFLHFLQKPCSSRSALFKEIKDRLMANMSPNDAYKWLHFWLFEHHYASEEVGGMNGMIFEKGFRSLLVKFLQTSSSNYPNLVSYCTSSNHNWIHFVYQMCCFAKVS